MDSPRQIIADPRELAEIFAQARFDTEICDAIEAAGRGPDVFPEDEIPWAGRGHCRLCAIPLAALLDESGVAVVSGGGELDGELDGVYRHTLCSKTGKHRCYATRHLTKGCVGLAQGMDGLTWSFVRLEPPRREWRWDAPVLARGVCDPVNGKIVWCGAAAKIKISCAAAAAAIAIQKVWRGRQGRQTARAKKAAWCAPGGPGAPPARRQIRPRPRSVDS
uniref:Uncharacterized protein n=1 Tax=Marseillevirus LCMAC103 TaxID=2506604 RepID=A0A481YV30_9VIRU|nr:MAG: hypothetical protein LCMAC103_00880 [Marseillevirus LCMAC103]